METTRQFGNFGSTGQFCAAYANSTNNGQDDELQRQSGHDPCNTSLASYDKNADPLELIVPSKIVRLVVSETDTVLNLREDTSDSGTFKVKLDRDPHVTDEDEDDDDDDDETEVVYESRTLSIASGNSELSFNPSSITFTGGPDGNWNTAVTVTVTATSDSSLDDETATINLTGTGIVPGSISVNLFEQIVAERSSGFIVITEGTEETFTYVLKSALPAGATRTIQVITEHDDLKVATGNNTASDELTLTFTSSNWNVAQTVKLSAVHDTGFDDHINRTVRTNPGNGLIAKSGDGWRVRVNLLDDDITVEVPSSRSVDEGGTRTFNVRLLQRPDTTRNIQLRWTNSDVTLTPSSLTFTNNSWFTSQEVTISAAEDDDTANEGTVITLNGKGFKSGSINVTVEDDDAVALTQSKSSLTIDEGDSETFTVKLATDPNENMSVTLASTNSDITFSPSATLNFTGGSAGNWNSAQTVTVNAAQDNDTPSDSATISLTGTRITSGSVTVKVIDDDDAALTLSSTSLTINEGSAGTFTVRLATEPGVDRTLSLALNNTDVTLDTDPVMTGDQNTLVFTTTDWNTPRTVTVRAAQDSGTDDEVATISLTGTGITAGSVSVTVNDDDDVALTLSDTSLNIVEGASDTFTVKLATDPGETMSVSLASDNTDVTLSPASLSFTGGGDGNWNTTQTVTVTAGQDDDFDNDNATISLTGTRITSGSVAVAVTDDDIGLTVSTMSLTFDEAASGTFTIELASSPTGDVTVTLMQKTPTNSDVTFDTDSATGGNQDTLTFTSANWNVAQTVTVKAASDPDGFDETADLDISASGGGYDGLTESVAITVNDINDLELTLSEASLTLKEGTSKTFTVKLATLPNADVSVTLVQPTNTDVTLDTDTNTANNQNTLTFTTADWGTTQTVTVNTTHDADAIDDTTTIALFASGGGYDDIVGSVAVTVTDDEKVDLTLSDVPLTLTEGSSGTFTVVLAADPNAIRTVSLASNNDDVTLNPASLTFAGGSDGDWSTPQTVTVSAAADADTADDSATISLTGDRIANASTTVTVTDDDVDLTLSKSSLNIDEGGNGSFTVQLARQPLATITVTLMQGGTGNTDVTVDAASLEFTTSNWNTPQTVTVSAAQDYDGDNDSATINLTGAQVTDASVTVTVADDEIGLDLSTSSLTVDEDDDEAFTVALKTQPTAAVTVTLAQSGTSNDDVTFSPSSLDFTSANWNTTQTVTVSAADDKDAADDSAGIDLSASGGNYEGRSARLSISVTDDDDPELTVSVLSLNVSEGGSGSFTVQLATQPSENVTVTLPQSANADVTVDKSSLAFTSSNWDTPQTVTVSAGQDSDSTDESARISLSASGGDYNNVTGSLTIAITDDDGTALTLSGSPLTVIEGGTGTFTVALASDPGGNRTVSLASNNDDVTLSDASLTFVGGSNGNWDAAQTVTVSAAEDNDIDDDSATISLTGTGITTSSATVTVNDDDVTLALSTTSLTIGEGNGGSITVQLARQPPTTITVTLTQPTNTDVTVNKTSLQFTTSNWDSPQTIRISAAQDGDSSNDSATINLTGARIANTSISVMVTDDDIGLTLSAGSLSFNEGGSASFTVKLKTRPTAAVTLQLAQSGTSNDDVSISPSSLNFTSTDWSTAQSVTVSAAHDEDSADDSATISLSATGGNYSNVTESLTVTVSDDDDPGLTLSDTPLTLDEGDDDTFMVELATQPSGNVTVTLTQPTNTDVTVDTDTSAANNQNTLTFTTDNWDNAQSVKVSAAHDNDTAADSASIALSASGGGYMDVAGSVSVTVIDDDDIGLTLSDSTLTVTEGSTATFTVALASDPGAGANRTLSLASNNSTVSLNAARLTFSGGSNGSWDDAQTVRISAGSDNDTSNGSATISLTGTGITSGSVAVTVADDDVDLTLSTTSLTLDEGDNKTFTVELAKQPVATVAVTLTQPTNTDVTVDQTSLQFTTSNWDSPQTVTVSAAQDDDVVDDSAIISLTGAQVKSASVTVSVTDDDIGLELSTMSLTFAEAGSGVFTVRLKTRPSNPVEVTLVQDPDGTVNDDVTFSPTSLDFTTTNWNTAQTVTVRAVKDDDAVKDSAAISLTASGGNYSNVSDSLSVSVTDNDSAALTISKSNVRVTEGTNGSGTFTVELATQPSKAVTVTLAQSGTANNDVSFSPASLDFTASNWDEAQTVTVRAGDDHDAADETATIGLTAAGGEYDDITGSILVTVADNDTTALTISGSSLSVDEGDSNTFTVQLATQPTGSVTVALAQSGTANNDVSFSPASLNFTASNWNGPQTVTVSAAHDADFDDDSASISLSASGSDYRDVTGSISIRVAEDDIGLALPESLNVDEESNENFTVALRTRPSAAVTITLSQSGQANSDVSFSPATLDFTTTNWSSPQTVTVSAADDNDAIADVASLSLRASGGDYEGVTGSLSVSVKDNDTTGLTVSESSLSLTEGGSSTFTVQLITRPSGDVTVTLGLPSSSDVTVDTDASATGNQNTLTFTSDNWDDAQTVAVNAGQDSDSDDDSTSIDLSASGGDYKDVTESVTVTVSDDDDPGLTLSDVPLTIDEDDSKTFKVALATLPSGDVTVTLTQPANTDVTLDTDASRPGNQNTLTFTTDNWDDAQTVTVRAGRDDDSEDDSASIALSASGGGYMDVAGSVTVTVNDSDFPNLVLTPQAMTVAEGGSGTFTVQLNTQPSSAATIALTSNRDDVTLSPASLTFTTDDWDTAQTVKVETIQDPDRDHHTAVISLAGAGITNASLSVTVADDGDVGLVVSTDSLPVNEGGEATFAVELHAQPVGDAVIILASDSDAITLSPVVLNFTTDNWDDAKTVTVSAANDSDFINDAALISLTGSGITRSALPVTIIDNDDGAAPEEEEQGVELQLAAIAANLVPASSSTVALRFDAPRGARTATVAGQQITLDRSLVRDLAAGFAGRAGTQGTVQDRFAEDRFGAERHSSDWLGGVPLENGRPLRSGTERSSVSSGRDALLSSFSYALGADAAGWSVWGRVDTGEFSGISDGVEFDGSQSSTWFGFDRRSEGGVLSGIAYSSSSSDSDYTLGRFGASIKTDMTIVMPYLEFQGDSGGGGHVMLGLVSGDATLNQTDKLEGSAGLSMYLMAVGGSWPAAELGNSTLSWSGDLGFSALQTSEPTLTALDTSVSSMQFRGGMELVHSGFGNSLKTMPRIGLLLRYDAGDGITGTGVELTAGMQMLTASERFSLDLNLRTLTMHSAEELSDWGAGLQLRLKPRGGGRGLAFAVGPTWGSTEDDLLDRENAFGLDEVDRQRRQVRGQDRGLAGNIGYGLRTLGGVLTPYSEYRFTSGSNGSTRQVAGVRFSGDDTLELRLFSERRIAHRGRASSRLALELQKHF